MALEYTSFLITVNVGSTSNTGWQNRLNEEVNLLLSTAENRILRSVDASVSYGYETTTIQAVEAAVRPWFQVQFALVRNDIEARPQIGRPSALTSIALKTAGGVSVGNYSSVSDVIFQLTNSAPYKDNLDFVGNGIRLVSFGYYNISGAPSTAVFIFLRLTIGWENLC